VDIKNPIQLFRLIFTDMVRATTFQQSRQHTQQSIAPGTQPGTQRDTQLGILRKNRTQLRASTGYLRRIPTQRNRMVTRLVRFRRMVRNRRMDPNRTKSRTLSRTQNRHMVATDRNRQVLLMSPRGLVTTTVILICMTNRIQDLAD
jgi:hypothetical protein